jgi:hypothetical protein
LKNDISKERVSLIKMEFIDYPTYKLSLAQQGSDEWKKLRCGRITSSNLSSCIGRASFKTSKYEIANKICNLCEIESNSYMQHGIEMEPIIRDWYSDAINKPIKELGIAIWKKDCRFGGSLDGEIDSEEGIEIKAPNKMYQRLVEYIESKKKGYNFYPGYHEHIFNSHYDQMMGNAIITNKKYIHYVVVCTDTQKAFVQRFPTDVELWEKELYPKACEFYDKYVTPLLCEKNITRIDP